MAPITPVLRLRQDPARPILMPVTGDWSWSPDENGGETRDGAVVLNYVVYFIVRRVFLQDRTDNEASAVQAVLQSSDFLADIAKEYGLDKRLRDIDSDARRDTTVLSDAFKAYVGSLHKEHGISGVELWLDSLLRLSVNDAVEFARNRPNSSTPTYAVSRSNSLTGDAHNSVDIVLTPEQSEQALPGALASVNEIITQRHENSRIEWDIRNVSKQPHLSDRPVWQVNLIFHCADGIDRVLGAAQHSKQKLAKNAAASEAKQKIMYQLNQLPRNFG